MTDRADDSIDQDRKLVIQVSTDVTYAQLKDTASSLVDHPSNPESK
jgi:hypothetical protein